MKTKKHRSQGTIVHAFISIWHFPTVKMQVLLAVLFNLNYSYAFSQFDIIIVGGGTGGSAAGIQAARMGAYVQILEPTPWLGGMLTAAGVSAIDGNHELPSGIWGEFRNALYEYYGGPQAVATGWVSHTLYEPSVGNAILREMASELDNLNIDFNAQYTTIARAEEKWIVHYKKDGKSYTTESTLLIDATETGEILPLVGAGFRVGMDSRDDTGEISAPLDANLIVQDITFAAILEDVGNSKSQKGLVKKPKSYNAQHYKCACNREGETMFAAVSDCRQMLNYAKLPHNKYLINWPHCGNDYYLNWPKLSGAQQQSKIADAKEFTLGFIYFLQNELGYNNLRLAPEFPTPDHLPFMPYHRESRRVRGKVFLTGNHLENPFEYTLFRTGIAVGDYPIDHHHDKNDSAPQIDFINIRIPSYNIPIGTLIPESVNNFLVAEKNISVSNIVNGTTRLQPVVLCIGQAAGTLAALSVAKNLNPPEVPVREVQDALLLSGAYIMPYIDTKPEDSGFLSMQRIGATGILKGFGVPYKWANQTWFYPDQMVSEYEWKTGLSPYYSAIKHFPASGRPLTLQYIRKLVKTLFPNNPPQITAESWHSWGVKQPYDIQTPLNRRSVSIITDHLLNPFQVAIDLKGKLNEINE
jgi:hypothetical protein